MTDRKNINPRRPIPSTQYDKLRDNLSSGFANDFPVVNFPNPDNRSGINKAENTTRKDDTIRDNKFAILPDQMAQLREYIDLYNDMYKLNVTGIQECEMDTRDNYTGRFDG